MYYETVIKWFIPLVLTSLFTFVAKIITDLKKDRIRNTKDHGIMNDATLALLRCEILTKIEFCLELGYLPDFGRVAISELYKIYNQLEESHGIDKLVDQCFSLPPKLEYSSLRI